MLYRTYNTYRVRKACNYLTISSGAKALRGLLVATMVASRATTEAPRKPRDRSMMPSRRIPFLYAPAPPRLLLGAFVGPSRSLPRAFAKLHQFNKPPVEPQLPNGRFYSESAIPSAQLCGVSIFGLGLGLKVCTKISTEPLRPHHGCFTEPSPFREKMTSPPGTGNTQVNNPGIQKGVPTEHNL